MLRGEPGIGKTAILGYAAERAQGFRVVRAAGVESEMELPFAGLHQLCGPMLGGLARLPPPQRDALRTAFGLSTGAQPDRFLVSLAVLSLLSDAAEERPLLCLVDDAQWLDRSSAQVLAFVARRLQAESVVLLFAKREPGELDGLAGLPDLPLRGLPDDSARELLASAIGGPLDDRVRDRILAEARGSPPLALMELPHELSPATLAGGFGLPGALPLPRRIEVSFRRRVQQLPAATQRLLLVAAAEPTGEPALLWRAAGTLGIPAEAAGPAEADGLLDLGAGVAFRHSLLRSAIYRAADAEERRRAHLALALATDAETDPDRRAWHRAHATLAPDEDVAQELERSAGRAQARGGLAAAAAFLEYLHTVRDRGGHIRERICPGHGQQPGGGAVVACPVSVTTTSLPDAMLGTRYSVPMLAVSGGIAPYNWSVSNRWLPPGLSLSPAGVIFGSPVLAGAFDFTVQAADSEGATATASLSITVGGCATKITGSRNRPLTIGAGVTCLDQAIVSGPVTIAAGAVVSIQASTLGGPLSADSPARLAVCGSTISGPASVTGASGPVLLGGASGTPCTADTVTGRVTLTGDAGGVTLGGATISGPAHVADNGGRVTVSGNTIGGPASLTGNTGATLVEGNSVNGALSCSGNNPAPTDGGKPNTSSGPPTGQCSSLT